MPRRAVFCRTVVLMLLPLMLACSTWTSYPGPSATATELPDRVRLQLRSGDEIVLDRPAIEGDSVWLGLVDAAPARIPVLDVTNVEELRISTGRTALLLGGFLVVAGGIGFFLWYASEAS